MRRKYYCESEVEQHKNIIQMLLLYYKMHPILATKAQLTTLLATAYTSAQNSLTATIYSAHPAVL
jgi:hypothetical protein